MDDATQTQYEQIYCLWKKYHIRTIAELDLHLHSFQILFAYNSGKIENDKITYQDTREIYENGRVQNYTGDTRTLFEVGNQKLCYAILKPKIIAKEPISLELIKEVQALLAHGTYDERRFIELGERPGEFKKHDFVTGVNEVGSIPEDVEHDMSELLSVLAEFAGKNILKLAAYFHVRFEYIHPFADGNSRTGRALMNYYLLCHDHPPIIIYEEDKAQYYAALQSYDENEDVQPMYVFLKEQTIKTWTKTLEREKQREMKRQEKGR